jgi:hypothetical protein
MKLPKSTLIILLLLGLVSLVYAEDEALPSPPERDFSQTVLQYSGFGFNGLALLSGTIQPNYTAFDRLLGDTYTLVTAILSVSPYTNGYWPYAADGTALTGGAELTDSNTVYKQLLSSFALTVYQGLYSDLSEGMAPSLNQLYVYAGYTAYFSYNYRDLSPGTYLFNSSHPEKDGWFGNVINVGIGYNDIQYNRALNIKDGFMGTVRLDWAPRALFNDLLGISDFTRLTAVLNSNIPLVADQDFSMYFFHKTGFDSTSAQNLPLNLQNIGHNLNRATSVPTAPMHLSNTFELRASFPSLFEPGMMPGLVLFWDYNLYSSPDYQFSFDRYRSALGAAVVVHLDLSSLVPNFAAAVDLQLGAVYEIYQGQAKFHFSMNLPE